MTMPGASIVEFMLSAILTALREASGTEQDTEQDTEQVTEQVGRLLTVLGESEQSAGTLMRSGGRGSRRVAEPRFPSS